VSASKKPKDEGPSVRRGRGPIALLAHLIAAVAHRRPALVLGLGVGLCAASAVSASRIQVKTAFQDTMADDDPIVRRMRYLGENFPGAVVVQVVLEGASTERLIECGEALRDGFAADPALVDQVYLEQDVDFFARRALLYLPERELLLLEENLRRNGEALRTLAADPSLLGLLRGVEALAESTVPKGTSAVTLQTRVFADVLLDSVLAGRPAANVGVKVDPGPLQKKLDADLRERLKKLPLPPSDAEARRTLAALEAALDLAADVLEEDIDEATFRRRAARLVELAPAGALPRRHQLSPDGRMLLVEVGSPKNLSRIEEIRPVLEHLERTAKQVKRAFPDVAIGFTGLPVEYAQEQDAILSNFVLVTLLGLLGILAVFVVGFEQVTLPALSALPLLMGIAWTFGVQGLVDPELNMLNLLFPVVLFGLGVDYAIHLLNGFAARRAAGDEVEAALRNLLTEMLPGILIGGATTAAAFFVLMSAHMKGLKTLGFTAGVGVVMAVVAMVTMLPAIFVLYDRRAPVVGMANESGLLVRLGGFVERQRYAVLAAALVFGAVAAYFAPRVSLERDALKMKPQGMPASVLQEKLLRAFGISGEPSIFFARDLEEARAIVEKAQRARTMSSPLSIVQALPDHQAEKAPLLARIRVALDEALPSARSAGEAAVPAHAWDAADIDELRTRLAGVKAALLETSAAAALLYRDETEDLVGLLRDDVNRIERRLGEANGDRLRRLDALLGAAVAESTALVLDMTEHHSVTLEDLPASLRARVAGRDGATMVLVRANGYFGDEEFLEEHVAELYGIHPEVAGIVPAWREMLRQILDDMPRLLSIIGVLVLVFVFIGLRSLKGVVLALLPLCLGVLLLLGALGAVGVDFSFVSVLALPLLFGTGVDFGVHLYERIRHDRAIGSALGHSGKALVLSSLTTSIGFGSLMLSVHRGVFGLGLVTALGILACLLTALLALPALVAIMQPELLAPLPAAPAEPASPEPASPEQAAPEQAAPAPDAGAGAAQAPPKAAAAPPSAPPPAAPAPPGAASRVAASAAPAAAAAPDADADADLEGV
jgi:uncharacterized protein